ncbi:MAG TPA: TIGR02300 family protein [Xanthobacteraceae bacterium]|nr:TIGR02300 family protein [Xanthobacteraceae bacterium]
MTKPELGTKRICPETGRKFYDLNKDPVISPYTGKVVPVEPLARARPEAASAARAAPPVEEVAAPEPADAEFVSLEEADAEASGATAKKPAVAGEAEVEEEEVEMDDEGLDDAPFIEEQEEEDTDVTDIIGSDRENEEEG